MSALLAHFQTRGVALAARPGGRIEARGPLTEDIRAAIRANKAALLVELAANPAVEGVTTTAQPVPGEPMPGATSEQAAELRVLVPTVCALVGEDDVAGCFALALADPVGALICYRALLADLTPAKPFALADDRRTCRLCVSLAQDGRCRAAGRGEVFGTGFATPRQYFPAMTDRPQRCAGYRPGPDDPDRRPGTERGPILLWEPYGGEAARSPTAGGGKPRHSETCSSGPTTDTP